MAQILVAGNLTWAVVTRIGTTTAPNCPSLSSKSSKKKREIWDDLAWTVVAGIGATTALLSHSSLISGLIKLRAEDGAPIMRWGMVVVIEVTPSKSKEPRNRSSFDFGDCGPNCGHHPPIGVDGDLCGGR
ncbi:hypothetical protein CRG98_018165 [Punica granatum]|uniref:Uncharacterized protein n=1 Tax=Punica granatum TaxID=22663 RepID=A0A2I0JZ04_PUNGR|nr:hypothetical protein CRG98_018165 [Punica granatum]